MIDHLSVPAWSLLTTPSFSALLSHRRQLPKAITILNRGDANLDSKFIGLVRLLLTRAVCEDGLDLTASGWLSRADVAALFDEMDWNIYERALIRSVNKVLDETNVTPIHAARRVAQNAGLLRRRGNLLYATKKAQQMGNSELFAAVFESMFWRTDLSELDGVAIRGWPQDHVGVTLWSISISADGWIEPEALMKLVTLRPLLERSKSSHLLGAFVLRILRPLVWLGMIEADHGGALLPRSLQSSPIRKSRGFDRSIHFDVGLHGWPSGQLH